MDKTDWLTHLWSSMPIYRSSYLLPCISIYRDYWDAHVQFSDYK